MSKKSSSFYRKIHQEVERCMGLINTDESAFLHEEVGTNENIPNSSSSGALVYHNSNYENSSHADHDDVESRDVESSFGIANENQLFNEELTEEESNYFHPDVDSGSQFKKKDCSTEFKLKLKLLALKHRISHSALTDFLKLLKTCTFLPNELPSDARTLLSTPRNTELRQVYPGNYCHVGVKTAINTLISKTDKPDKIEMLVNIDGLPLSKSSGSQVYPILCSINDNIRNVAIIGVYHGYEKPASANDFLQEFVDEAIELTNNGVVIGEHSIPFQIKGLVCDAPAKSYISYRKGHTGFYSCTKCMQKGKHMKGRTCFPKVDCLGRTDTDFRNKVQKEHHLGTSILENIPLLNMIESFPLDYMHLVCLGVVKKLLVNLWLFGKPPNRLSSHCSQEISVRLLSLQNHVPIEFARKPRTLDEVKRWKATEFRFFLFYSGPVVLKELLDDDKYLNFLCLHISMRILNNSILITKYLDYATSLLVYFVQKFAELYGQEYVSHNVHGLIHVPDDVKAFGNLDRYSAFPFENFLQTMKKMIRKHDKPLAQIMRRIKELENVDSIQKEPTYQFSFEHLHSAGPEPDKQAWTQYELLKYKYFTINIKKHKDSFCLLEDNSIVKVYNILRKANEIFIYGKRFSNVRNFFSLPCESSAIGIFEVQDLTDFILWPIESISTKLVAFPQNSGYIVFPLLHEN